MPAFVTFTTYSDEDPKAIREEEFNGEDDLPEDWAEWVRHEASNEAEAIANHYSAFDAWQSPND